MKWTTKRSIAEKETIRLLHTKNHPRITREFLNKRDNWLTFVASRKISPEALDRIKRLIRGTTDVDFRDHRKLQVEERVPRTLEYDDTPPRYWLIED